MPRILLPHRTRAHIDSPETTVAVAVTASLRFSAKLLNTLKQTSPLFMTSFTHRPSLFTSPPHSSILRVSPSFISLEVCSRNILSAWKQAVLKGEPLLTPWAVIQPASSAGTALDWLVVRYACQFKIQLVVDRGSLFTVTGQVFLWVWMSLLYCR